MEAPSDAIGREHQTKWTPFKMEFSLMERAKMLFQNMEPDVLYYPDDTTFPLVDLYYKDKDGKLFGIQATMAEKHAKDVSVYQSLYDEYMSKDCAIAAVLPDHALQYWSLQ